MANSYPLITPALCACFRSAYYNFMSDAVRSARLMFVLLSVALALRRVHAALTHCSQVVPSRSVVSTLARCDDG